MKSRWLRFVPVLALSGAACSQTAEEPAPAADPAAEAGTGGSAGGGEASADEGETDGVEGETEGGGTGDATDSEHHEDGEHDGEGHDDPLARAHAELERALADRQRARRAQREEILSAKTAAEQAQAELHKRLASIEALESEIDRRLGVGKVARERRLQRLSSLAALVAGMPPQAGAEIVAQMPDEDAQDLLLAVAQKNDRRAAKLLSLMPPHRAAALGKRYLDTDPEALPLPDGRAAGQAKVAGASTGAPSNPTAAPATPSTVPASASAPTPAGDQEAT